MRSSESVEFDLNESGDQDGELPHQPYDIVLNSLNNSAERKSVLRMPGA